MGRSAITLTANASSTGAACRPRAGATCCAGYRDGDAHGRSGRNGHPRPTVIVRRPASSARPGALPMSATPVFWCRPPASMCCSIRCGHSAPRRCGLSAHDASTIQELRLRTCRRSMRSWSRTGITITSTSPHSPGINAAHRPRVITPLGNDTIMRNYDRSIAAEAYDWGERTELGAGVTVTLVPTQHWSARSLSDRNMSLWASFIIETPAGTIYFVADSGYGDGSTFRNARAGHGPFKLAILPIGAYEPRWFMRDQHMNPAEAVQAFAELPRRVGARPPLRDVSADRRSDRCAGRCARGGADRSRHRAGALSHFTAGRDVAALIISPAPAR